MTNAKQTLSIVARDFSKDTIKALRARGICIVGVTFLPGTDGSFANGERGYRLDDNGTGRIRTFMQVLALAA